MRTRIILPLLSVLLASCMKEELPIPPTERGPGAVMQACLGPGYQDQVWIDLGSGSVVATNSKFAWDLALESDADGWRIQLNGARLMAAWLTTAHDMALVQDTIGMSAGKLVDMPSGHPDSTAVGDWRIDHPIHVIDLGLDANGSSMGMWKLHMLHADANEYRFEVAHLDGSQMRTVVLPKDHQRAHTCFSFAQGAVTIEPPQGTWDIVLTQYTHRFREYDPVLSYLVTGALIDRTTTRVARIPNTPFELVSLSDTIQHPFHDRRDIIGYDWKAYSFVTSSYTVVPDLNFILEDAEGFFDKEQFTEFHGPQGQVGCPEMRVLPL